jgi:glycosyltransferase involved in cell wall biosynthesis
MKKTVVLHSNHSRVFTGFGKNMRNVLRYLHKTGKYNLVEFANSKTKDSEELKTLPWRAYGTLPENSKLQSFGGDQTKIRTAAYGLYEVDGLMKEVKPDFYIGIEDIWALAPMVEKKWWNENCMVWTTLDSLPIYPDALRIIPKVKHYYAWASFVSKEVKRLGYEDGAIKTLRGAGETSAFYRLSDDNRAALRKEFNLSDEFIIGFVFRNQLRKSVPNLLQGFKIFKDKNPKINAKLLLHTHWSEGWDIPRLIKDAGIENSDVLTTYFCKSCKQFEVKPFVGQKIQCRYCGAKGTVETTNISEGVSESQLNEVYNLMDVYCHPFTSGGQEIPITEAKLTELVTLATNYSCGEDFCTEESGGIPLNWKPYYEPGSNFIKATTLPESIAERLERVYKMSPAKRAEMGKVGRQFVIDNLSAEIIGKQLEKIIDEAPIIQWDFNTSFVPRDTNYNGKDELQNLEWVIDLYTNILKVKVDSNDDGVKSWMSQLNNGIPRQQILNYFKNVAAKENQENVKVEFSDILDKEDKSKRILFVMPESAGDVFLSTSLLPSIKKLYPDFNIYFATKPEYLNILEGNPLIHKAIVFSPFMENLLTMEGHGAYEGYFNLAYLPHFGTQKLFDYQHNGADLIELNLYSENAHS